MDHSRLSRCASLAGAGWLGDAATQAVFAALSDPGVETRAVGGAVRNALLGLEVKDVDFATTAHPDQTIQLANRAGLKAVPTGRDHGTITVIADGRPFEVTTLRADVETDGRHAKVRFTRDWREDAGRRDFTINALYCDATGAIIDPLDGWPDIAARRIRFIGSARDRIREDYLRSLRFFRLWAEYGLGQIDQEGLTAVRSELEGLRRLSGERIRFELLRLLVAPRALEAVEIMDATGVLSMIVQAPADIASLGRLIEIEAATGQNADAVLRLAAMWVHDAATAQSVGSRLRLSNEETATLLAAAVTHPALAADAPNDAAKLLLFRVGPGAFEAGLMVGAARTGVHGDDPRLAEKMTLARTWLTPPMPVSGLDVMDLGISPGPRVGRLLAAFEDAWAKMNFTTDRDWALAELATLAKTVK